MLQALVFGNWGYTSNPEQYLLSIIYSTGCYGNTLIDTNKINVSLKNNVLSMGQFFISKT